MGLSSSQARLLNLTSRMHQIEYNAARIEAMKLQMANESRKVYNDYLEALDKTKVQVKTLNPDGSVTYKDVVDYATFTKAGYYLVYVDEAGSYFDTKALDDGGFGLADGNSFTIGGQEVKINTFNTEVLTNLINTGHFIIKTTTIAANTGSLLPEHMTSVSTDTGLQEVQDEVNLKKAEAKYEADMRRIDMKDRKYDYDLAALDNERNAVKQEMETLQTVAKDNVERTFKLFS